MQPNPSPPISRAPRATSRAVDDYAAAVQRMRDAHPDRQQGRWFRAVAPIGRALAELDEGIDDSAPTPQGCVAMLVCAVVGIVMMWGVYALVVVVVGGRL